MYALGTAGLELIKSFEGCKLKAYKPVSTEKYYTIGYGHSGADVTKNMTITQAQADEFLRKDCDKFVAAVNKYANLDWMNQNRFDALVSFTYNCGAGNLTTLLDSGRRTAEQVAAALPKYNKSSGTVLNGLVRRRAAELKLFNQAQGTVEKDTKEIEDDKPKFLVQTVYTTTVNLNVRESPNTTSKILKTYKKGTRFTCKAVVCKGDDIWICTPSGWIAAYYNGKLYCD